MKKKLVALILSAVACCALAFVACGKDKDKEASPDSSVTESVEITESDNMEESSIASVETPSQSEESSSESSSSEDSAEVHTHTYEWKKSGDNHWKECACGDKTEEEQHVYKWKIEGDKHWKKCACGKKIEEGKHTYTNGQCVCGLKLSTEGLEYTLSYDGTYYSVTGIGTATDTDIVIPSTYNNLPVTEIGYEAFSDCSSLTSVDIPDSVTSIGEWAFGYCSSLTSVVIPDSVTLIGSYAFHYCSSLTSVVIPDSVTTIGDYSAFGHCSSLTSITVNENNKNYKSIDGNLYTKDGAALIQYAIGKTATEFNIPDSVIAIGDYTFSGCESLTSVVIPDGATSIGEYAFSYCYRLTSIVIPDSVTTIDDFAFYNCSSLTSVYYTGTSEEWLAISIGSSNKELIHATIYYYSESQPTEEGNYWHYVDGVPTVW